MNTDRILPVDKEHLLFFAPSFHFSPKRIRSLFFVSFMKKCYIWYLFLAYMQK